MATLAHQLRRLRRSCGGAVASTSNHTRHGTDTSDLCVVYGTETGDKYIASVGRALLEEAGFCSAGGSGKDKKGGGGASTGKR